MRDKDFPNLDSIYILSEVLDINPNDLLEAKNKTQDGMRKKTSPALRRCIYRVWKSYWCKIKIWIECWKHSKKSRIVLDEFDYFWGFYGKKEETRNSRKNFKRRMQK